MKINIYNETDENINLYKRYIYFLFKQEKNNYKFSLTFIDDKKMQELNLKYRNIDKTTDVLSFAYLDDPTYIYKDDIGDIFISIDKAKEQAKEYGHSIIREICFLTIHGYLHLLGYDHLTKEDEGIMFSLQEKILNKAGIKRCSMKR